MCATWKLQRAHDPRIVDRDSCLAAEAYHYGEAVVSLETVFITLGLGVVITPHFIFRGKVHVMVHELTPLHEEHGSLLVQNILLIQIGSDLVRDFTRLHMERPRWKKACFEN